MQDGPSAARSVPGEIGTAEPEKCTDEAEWFDSFPARTVVLPYIGLPAKPVFIAVKLDQETKRSEEGQWEEKIN